MAGPDDRDDATHASPPTVLGWQAPATGEHPGTTQPLGPVHGLEPGDRIGDRYMVRALLGRGGMGAVYHALDEKLGVEVALKTVGDALAAALRDEVRLAQKVAHPNVCRTYDLEEVDGQYYVKMELVTGETLAMRLKRDGRLPIDEAVRIARAVAAGLAAAHDAGVVHRDLKPSNVMLSGERVLLMDFGIARNMNSTMSTLAGTFGYMAPEQFANTRVDRRVDLYALGCLLYEMLAGELVFGSANPIELAARHVMVAAPDVRDKRPDTPRWLARAVAALLAKDPAGRDAGLARLVGGPRSLRRFALPVGAFVLAAAGAAMLVVSTQGRQPAAPVCRGADARLAGVWDAAGKKTVSDAFAATKKPFAPRAYAALEHALDGYATAWTAAVTEACEATRVRGEETEDVLVLREACLDRRLDELHALVGVLANADAELVAKGDQLATGLPQLADCANVAELRAPDRPPTEPKDKVAEAQHALAEAEVDAFAGHQLAALNAAKHAERVGDELHYPPFKAEALKVQGIALGVAGNIDEALRDCTDAFAQAVLGHRDDLVVDSAACAAGLAVRSNVGEARVWLRISHAFAPRLGRDPTRAVQLAQTEQLVAAAAGDAGEALNAQERALAETEHQLGADSPLIWLQEEAIGEALATSGAYDKALPHFEHALAIHEASVGPDHPDVANILANLGACYSHQGDAARARTAYERALAIVERTAGEGSTELVRTLNNMADAATKAGDTSGALVYLDRAKHAVETSLGEGNPLSHAVLTTRAEALAAAGRRPDARAQFDQAIALETRYSSPYLAATLTSRGALELAEKKWRDAAAFDERAITAAEAAGGKESPELWLPLAGLARADVELGKRADARPLLERALAIGAKAQVPARDLAPARDLLAKLAR
ncbi:MAG TPA: serine/threonine-protein kinase [Kofleriaceae bacterium]|nr:serine/threonine-protein kinase [Kofleriaceae bacterium]